MDSEDAVTNPAETSSNDITEDKPKNVSDRIWQKFQALHERRKQLTKKSTEKRILQLQKEATAKVQKELQDDASRAILEEHVRLPGASSRKRSADSDNKGDSSSSSTDIFCKEANEKWQEIRGYLGINNHISHIDRGKYAPQSGVEKEIDEAISRGEFLKAEQLSDHLANRQFGKKIVEAIDAMRYAEKKQKEEEFVKAKKRKKLPWGFDHKQRWETKSNM
eukprot:GHVU01106613.1.p1 GENE.GHVU01106613.1~~GHVU01106613.1.p1  ORF type:complete len:221 (-),score=45.68 GHVU01106613.1:508-1170(-)